VAEGTATADGDAREVQALSEALGAARPARTARASPSPSARGVKTLALSWREDTASSPA
jgi:hypothetical protein